MRSNQVPTAPADKLYVLVRADLGPGLQLAQSGHALTQFCIDYPETAQAWHATSNNLVVLAVLGEAELMCHVTAAQFLGVAVSVFAEPDLDNEFTAAAFAPSEMSSNLFAVLPLAGREAVVT